MSSISGFRGGRLHRPKDTSLAHKLGHLKEEIIDYAVDSFEDYDTDWLAKEVCDIWWEDLPTDVTPEQVLPIIEKWDSEIRDRIKESLEPTPLEEARRDIIEDTIRGLR